MCYVVPEPMEFNGKTITPQNLYVALFVIGMLFFFAISALEYAFIRD